MGFLKKDKAPDELPDLALHSVVPTSSDHVAASDIPAVDSKNIENEKKASEEKKVKVVEKKDLPDVPKEKPAEDVEPVEPKEDLEPKKEIEAEENKEEPKESSIQDKIREIGELSSDGDVTQPKFFDKVLNDINGEINDLGGIEKWYKNDFSKEDIVSNMKGYWEGNKNEIIIQSFGTEYKKRINDNIKDLQKLEEDWRAIYFDLIKKEEEMKKVEQQLKATLSEFVDLCKRRKNGDKEEKK